MTSRVAPTRGRKRFASDINHAALSAVQGVEVQNIELSGNADVTVGEDDGSFELTVRQTNGEFNARLTILVSDASEYPSDHTFFCSCQQELPSDIRTVLESVPDKGSITIQALLLQLLELIARKVARSHNAAREGITNGDDSAEYSEDEDDDYGMDDYDSDIGDLELFGVQTAGLTVDRAALQREFNEIVAHGYHPGFIRLGADDFALSVSLAAKSLADMVSPHALLAWDKQLLTGPPYLTLLISGLRGVYPLAQSDGAFTQPASARSAVPQFRIGLTSTYKPDRDDTIGLIRRFALQENDPPHHDEDLPGEQADGYIDNTLPDDLNASEIIQSAQDQSESEGRAFRPFSLSSSLESLLNGHFLQLLQLRLQHGLGWAGAEVLRWEIESSQNTAEDILWRKEGEIRQADQADAALGESYCLPPDCLLDRDSQDPVNLPLAAFSYLLRRLTLCPRYCLVCHQQLKEDLDALKPYVCKSTLCTYQYYNLNRGPSLEYEICSNPATVDLLVSLAYVAAAEGSLDAPLPIGMGIRVKCRNPAQPSHVHGEDGLCELDRLDIVEMRNVIRDLIDLIPPILQLKRHLEKPSKPGRAKPRLQDINRTIPEAVWLILRWCVASCTAHLEELTSDEEKVKNMDPMWRQFRFSVGAPDAEAKFRDAVQSAKSKNPRACEFPALYAFHGSAAKNWHSIIRHGLWFKTVVNGRAFGHGVYFAKDGAVSLSGYSAAASSHWRNSAIKATACVALAEIVNLPREFVSTSPYFVVNKTEWIVCRYLMVRGPGTNALPAYTAPVLATPATGAPIIEAEADLVMDNIPYVPLDPQHPLTLGQALIRIPEPSFALGKLLAARRDRFVPVQYDDEDARILAGRGQTEEASDGVSAVRSDGSVDRSAMRDDWKHESDWVKECIEHMMPPPRESSQQASMALQRELRAMLQEQKTAKSLRELGWYLPEEFIGDNLYQWIVELHSFDSSLPIAQDLAAKKVNSLVFEIRFPATFPHSPPFFRILKPRFLPFIQGGGGHITGGGSMCMDLLTADGWLPIYSISAILLQIKLAISNLDPRPARLAQNWATPYGMNDALEGYKRAASTHGWKVPDDLEKLTR